jgi:hypothetical protein
LASATNHNFKSASVTAPSEALVTVWAYLASTPRGKRGAGFFHNFLRFLNSPEGTTRFTTRFSASIVIGSPFFTSAIGPGAFEALARQFLRRIDAEFADDGNSGPSNSEENLPAIHPE